MKISLFIIQLSIKKAIKLYQKDNTLNSIC